MNSSSRFFPVAVLLLWLVTAGSGCQMFHNTRLLTAPTASAEHPVVEIICVWQPGEGTGLDGLPTRGFAGQVIFFAMGQTAPVKVDGKVRIYVFDDQGTEEEQMEPIHQFDFDGSSFQTFLTQTNMGAAYQLFIPYTKKGTFNTACTLRVRYTPFEGSTVYSKMATVVLPGMTKRKPEQSVEATTSTAAVQAGPSASEEAGKVELASASVVSTIKMEEETNLQEKKRLRETLTAIQNVPAESSSAPAAATTPAPAEESPSTRLKLHPLANVDAPPVAATETTEKEGEEKPVETPPVEKEAAKESSPESSSHHPLADD